MTDSSSILVVTHLYLFPDKKLKRGGLIIHHSLNNLRRTEAQVAVAFFVPAVWSLLKMFSFDWKKIQFKSYHVDDIVVKPVPYIPRLSKWFSNLDKVLKLFFFSFFFSRGNDRKYDFIYGQTLYPDGPLLPWISDKLNSKYIVCLRGSDVHTFSKGSQKIQSTSKKVLKNAALVLSVSEVLKNDARKLFGHDFVDNILYTVCQIDVFRNTRSISKNLNRLVFIGALVRAKGINELLGAMSTLVKEFPNLHLELIGGGDVPSIEKFIEDNDLLSHITLSGKISKRDDLSRHINNCDVLVFPSYNEGLPNAVVEAVACERAVICSDVGGVKEISKRNSAFQLIPSKNEQAIVDAYKNLKKEDYQTILSDAKNNRNELVKRFSPDSQLSNFKNILSTLKESI